MDSAGSHFFEGAEKLLEIWFDPATPCGGFGSLRSIPRVELEALVGLANAQIVSEMRNGKVDAYVLSESSLFVSDHRLLIKTCGTTTLLTTLQRILQLAATYANLNKVAVCNYSRRNFLRPELQPSFHQTFGDEVEILENLFPSGAGYCMGKVNKDRWYLYNYSPSPESIQCSDQTIEIMMSDLDADVMSVFTKQVSSSALEARKLSGIDKLMPSGTIIDDKLFDPCGYSMNALVANDDTYYTIHITPEALFSYVSFETNVLHDRYMELVQRVVNTFKPGSFLVTLCVNSTSVKGCKGQKDVWMKNVVGYDKKDLQLVAVSGGTILYAHFKKKS